MTMHSLKTTATLFTDNVNQINGFSFLSTATLLKEAIWTEIRNVRCIPPNLLSHHSQNNHKKISGNLCYIYKPNIVHEFTMQGHNTCFLKITAFFLTD